TTLFRSKAALGEELEREHRIRHGGAPGDECADQRETAGERAEGPQIPPSPLVGLNDPERDEDDRDRDGRGADEIGQTGAFRLARLVEEARSEDRRHDADRNVDDEDRAPAPRFDEEPADRRTERGSERAGGAPERDRLWHAGL